MRTDRPDVDYRAPLPDWAYNAIAYVIAFSVLSVFILGIWKAINIMVWLFGG